MRQNDYGHFHEESSVVVVSVFVVWDNTYTGKFVEGGGANYAWTVMVSAT